MYQLTQVIRILKTPVTLLVLLALLFGASYWGYKAVTADSTKADAKCVMTDVGGELTPKSVQVRSLNAGGKGGLAKQTANDLRPYGFTVIRVGNDSDRIVDKTVIVGNAADDPEVRLVQQFFPDSVAEGDGRPDHVVDVLVGTAFVRTPNSPKTTVAVDGPVCLPPPITTGTASPTAGASASPSPSPSSSKKK